MIKKNYDYNMIKDEEHIIVTCMRKGKAIFSISYSNISGKYGILIVSADNAILPTLKEALQYVPEGVFDMVRLKHKYDMWIMGDERGFLKEYYPHNSW